MRNCEKCKLPITTDIWKHYERDCLITKPQIRAVDNGTLYGNVGHMFRGEEDVCLKFFGEQDEECIKHNEKE